MGINKFEFIHPSSDWQELDLGNFDPQKFKIALDQFFIDHSLTYQYLDPDLMNPTPDDH